MSNWRKYGAWRLKPDRAQSILDTLTDRERQLLALAFEAGRNHAAGDLRVALGIGATFERAPLDKWVESQTEYSVRRTLKDEDLDHVVFIALERERQAQDEARYCGPDYVPWTLPDR